MPGLPVYAGSRGSRPHFRKARLKFRRPALPLVCWFSITTVALCAAPDLKYLYPAAAQRGTNSLVSIDKSEAWPRLWSNNPGVTFTPTPMLGVYNVEIAADALLGPALIRTWNEEGASVPRGFIITDEPELRSIEPNDSYKAPQYIAKLPAAISGKLEKNGDVDVFAVDLKRGQVLIASVQSHVLASKLDPLLRIVDGAGRALGFNHDSRTIDPFLAWEAPADGTYFVQVMGFAYPAQSSVQLTGGDGCLYRLQLTTEPTARVTAPAAVQAGTKTPLHLIGWNLPTSQADFDATALSVGSKVQQPLGTNVRFLEPLRVTDLPEIVEQDGTDSKENVAIPTAVTGRIRKPGEVDRYPFTAAKGQILEITVEAAQCSSPLDAWLAIHDREDKELARNDDTTGRDPRVKWTAPADGTYTIAIGDLTHRGSDDFLYRAVIREAAPSVTATSAAHAFTVNPGKTAEIKVNVKRSNGFKAALELTAIELPAGVAAAPVEVPEKDGEVTLKLAAEESAGAANAPLRLVLREKENGRTHPVIHQLAATSEDNGVPQGYADLLVNTTEQLWLTVTAPPTAK